jgi:hypothetical protein
MKQSSNKMWRTKFMVRQSLIIIKTCPLIRMNNPHELAGNIDFQWEEYVVPVSSRCGSTWTYFLERVLSIKIAL